MLEPVPQKTIDRAMPIWREHIGLLDDERLAMLPKEKQEEILRFYGALVVQVMQSQEMRDFADQCHHLLHHHPTYGCEHFTLSLAGFLTQAFHIGLLAGRQEAIDLENERIQNMERLRAERLFKGDGNVEA